MQLGIILYSQKQPEHQKKIYLSPDNKLYCNKSLPVYFWISNSPDENAKKYKLKSETTPQYTNPMYFDTDGRNTFRSPYAVDTITKRVVEPKVDVEYQVYADALPPLTTWSINKATLFGKNKIYYTNSKELILSSTDDLSGVDGIMYSMDSSEYKKYGSVIQLTAEKQYSFKFYAFDNTGNVEKQKEIKIAADFSAPQSSLNYLGEKYKEIISGNCNLEIQAADAVSGVKRILYSIDDTILKTYVGKIFSGNLSQGSHTIRYCAIDNVNNLEKVHVDSFYVDKTPPQVLEEVVGKTFYANGKEFSAGTSRLKISSFDNKAGVKEIYYSINNGVYEKYEKPIVLSNYKGVMLINSYAVDNVGNKGEYNASNSRNNSIPYVDVTAPWIGYSFSGPVFGARDTIFISQKTLIKLDAKDNESGIQKIEYQLDSSDIALFQKSFNIVKEGSHKITIFGYDNTDNMTRQEFSVVVDTTGPQIFERYSVVPINNEYPQYMVIFLSATDYSSGYQSLSYQLNNLPWQLYSREIGGFANSSTNVIIVKAIDKLGNITKRRIEFKIK